MRSSTILFHGISVKKSSMTAHLYSLRRKHFCARPDALLIDDGDHNVEAFRANGGQTILVPRPWNSLHYMPTETHLHDAFTMFFRMKEHAGAA